MMEAEGLADHFQVLEELGRKCLKILRLHYYAVMLINPFA